MIGATKVAAALMLTLALTAGIGVAVMVPGDGPDTASTTGDENLPNMEAPVLELSGDSDVFTAESPGDVFETEDVVGWPETERSGGIAIGLAARWGYLNDPAMAKFGGHWVLADESSGNFRGAWHALGTRSGGNLWGGFRVAPDGGHGSYAGKWDFADGRDGGYLDGNWARVDGRPGGTFDGIWKFADGKPGGALRGQWQATARGEGEFSGLAIHAPTMDMVPWDGFTEIVDGGVRLVREVRFEHRGDYRNGGDDLVYRQTERNKLEWRSSTTVNWDGLLMGIVVQSRDARVSFSTAQWSKEFTAGELVGLRLRVPVDRLGHEIELRGFLIPKPRPECGDGGMVKASMSVRWGYLGERERPDGSNIEPREDGRGLATWDGFIQVTRGGVGLRAVIDFEKGGEYREGNDDFIYPRVNRQTLEWRSSTTDDFDGVTVVMCIPTLRGMPVPHVTVHTDLWSHVYGLDDLRGLHQVYDVDDLGHKVEVFARIG